MSPKRLINIYQRKKLRKGPKFSSKLKKISQGHNTYLAIIWIHYQILLIPNHQALLQDLAKLDPINKLTAKNTSFQ